MAAKKYCPDCGITHTSLMCFWKPRTPIKKVGKVNQEWMEARREWIKNNPPDHDGYWYCIYCGCALTLDNLTLDHMYSRGRHPDQRTDQSNLAPCCYDCNQIKGSKDIDQVPTFFK